MTKSALSAVGKSTPLRSPIKWAGGKRWLVPRLAQMWERHSEKRLVEPFCGGLSVSLGLMPKRTLLNDVNPHLMNFLNHLREGMVVDLDMRNDKDLYYRHRARFNEIIGTNMWSSREAASLFYYLNKTGFNGLCRFNKKGRFNVPFGKHRTISYVRDFSAYRTILSQWQLTCQDFRKLIICDSDFIYADPPYDVEFTQYSKGGFSWEDQVDLAHWLAKHPGPVVASNQATKRVLRLYTGLSFEVDFVKAPRMIACTGDRTEATEILATKGVTHTAGRN